MNHGESLKYSDPSREGYTFTGWSASTINITSDATLIAKYEIKNFLVDFYCGEELIESVEVEYNSTPIAPSKKVEGKEFVEWDTDFSNVMSNLKVNAIYKTSTYTVTFMNYNMILLKSETVEYGNSATPPAASKQGATFTNWSGSYNNITSDVTLVAEFDEITFSVSFYGYDSLLIHMETVKLMQNTKLPTPPHVEGYKFSHWDGNYENITKDELVYAVYRAESKIDEIEETIPEVIEPATYTVKFYDINNQLYLETSIQENEAITPPNLMSLDGYDFLGWDKALNAIASDLTVKPIYKKKMFTVDFIDYDESIIKSEIVSFGDSISHFEVSRDGFIFEGWDTDFETIQSNLKVKAIYSPINYQVQFKDINGVIIKTVKVKHGENIIIADPYHVGYTFIGWDKDINYIVEDLMVNAKYEILEEYINENILPTIFDISIVDSNKIKLVIDNDYKIDINYLQIDNQFYSDKDFLITSKNKGLFSGKNVIEIVFAELEFSKLQVISITDKLTNKEYLYDLRIENRELVNNIFNDHGFKISTELSTFEKLIMWIKQLFE